MSNSIQVHIYQLPNGRWLREESTRTVVIVKAFGTRQEAESTRLMEEGEGEVNDER